MRTHLDSSFDWLYQGLLFGLFVGLVLGVLVGLALLVRPAAVFALNDRLSRWIDTSERFRRLETPVLWERLFYRHHRLVGAALMLGAGYVLGSWWFAYDRSAALGLLGPRWRASGLDWLLDAAEWVVVALHVLVLVVGAVVFARPSLLKDVEKAANRWHDVPSPTSLDTVVARLEPGLQLHPRLSGLVLVLSAGWCLARLATPLLEALGR